MDKMKAYCLDCNKEQLIIIDRTIIYKHEKKIIGRCKKCGAELCRIFIMESPTTS